MYDSQLRNLFNLTGEQIGSYFGYAVCVADLNGDKLDDIVIGAPFYTDYSNTEGKYETGRVVVAYQSSQVSRDRGRGNLNPGSNDSKRLSGAFRCYRFEKVLLFPFRVLLHLPLRV